MVKYQKVSVPGDGECLFHSISAYLSLDENRQKIGDTVYTYKSKSMGGQLRKQAVQWMKSNLKFQLPNGLTLRDDILDDIEYESSKPNPNYSTIEEYLDYMKLYDSYGGQIEITALSNILNRSIRTFVLQNKKMKNIGLGYEIPNSEVIQLYHNSGIVKDSGIHHFEVLYPNSRATVVSETQFKKLVKSSKTKKPKKPEPKKSKSKTKMRKRIPKYKTRRSKTRRNKTRRNKTRRKN